MRILIKNASIITMENKDCVIKDGFILIQDAQIKYVGTTEPINLKPDKIINGRNKVVLPGLINCHTHSPMTLMRCLADDSPLHEWLFEKIFPVEATLYEEEVYWGSMLGIMEMLASGITCFADMYFHMNGVARAVSDTGIRACLCTGITNIEKSTDFSQNSYIIDNQNLFEKWNGHDNGRISVYFGPHSVYTCEPEILHYIAELAHQLNTGIHIHISETHKENIDCLKQYGKTPVSLLNELGLFSVNTIAAHCVHINEEDMDILRKNNVTIAYNPTSNLKLGSGIAPIQSIRQKGINITLGTDGASSNNNLNLFEEINLAAMITKGVAMDPTLINAFEALAMATVNGASALGKEREIGIIKPGMKADLVILNLDEFHYYPLHNLISGMVYSAQAADVETVIVNGKILMENREFKIIDREQVIFEVKKIADRIGA